MIRFFSTGYLSRYLLLILLGLIIWTPSLLFPTSYNGISSFAFDKISYITTQNIYIQTSISFVLTLVTAFILNQLAVNSGFNGKVSTLVALLYLLLSSALLGEFHNNPVIWINFILVFVQSLSAMFRPQCYRHKRLYQIWVDFLRVVKK